jgi:hypothetical protein
MTSRNRAVNRPPIHRTIIRNGLIIPVHLDAVNTEEDRDWQCDDHDCEHMNAN